MARVTDALQVLDAEFGHDPVYVAEVERERERLQVAQLVYDARTRVGLTQKELAARVGTTQSVIARLESADYEGHTVKILSRIAAALGQHVEIRFVSNAGAEACMSHS